MCKDSICKDLCEVTLCKKVTLSITILKFVNIWRQIIYHFLGLIDIGSAIKVAGFGIKSYLLKKQNKLFWYEGKCLYTLNKCHFTQQNKLFCHYKIVVTLREKVSLYLTRLLSVS